MLHGINTPGSRRAAVLLVLLPAASAFGQCVEPCTVIHTIVGEAPGDQHGWVSNDVGDLTGDGIHDFLLTAPTNDAAGSNAGRVYVYDGASGVELFRMTGPAAGWWFGHDATTAGDWNDDGTLDLIVGAPFGGAGRATIHSGVDGSIIQTFNGQGGGDQFGFRVSGGGDFNGDGAPDVIIGAPNHDTGGPNAGRAYVYSGATNGLICAIDGDAAGDRFGSGVTFIGDVTGDGADDVAIGAMNAGPAGGGLAYAYRHIPGLNPCQRLFTMDPLAPAVNFGQWFMDGGPDVNADGTPDIYVNDFAANRAHVFSGTDGVRLEALTGDGNGQFGIGRLVEDVNGDGHDDLILAAWISPAGANQAGKAFVYSGADYAVLETFTHDVAGAGFGFDANDVGDVNGDGKTDYLVTAALDNANGGRGISYVLAGGFGTGDLDGSGGIDIVDLLDLLGAWGPCPGPCPPTCAADLDADCDVGITDLLLLLANWST